MRRLSLLVGLLAALCLPAVAAAAPVWTPGPVRDLGADVKFTIPDLAVAPDGTVTAVFERTIGEDKRLIALRRPPGGTWGAPIEVGEAVAETYDEELASVASAPNGDTVVAWRHDGPGNSVRTNTIRADGTLRGMQILDDTYPNGIDVDVAPDGGTTVLWTASIDSHLYRAYRPPGLLLFGGRAAVSSHGSGGDDEVREFTSQFGPDGRLVVAYAQENGALRQVRLRRWTPGGSLSTAPIISIAVEAPGNEGWQPDLAVDSSSRAHVVFEQNTDGTRVVDSRVSEANGDLGPVRRVGFGDTDDPDIHVTADGTGRVVWRHEFDELQTRSWVPAGALGPVDTISDPDHQVLWWWSVADASGATTIGWRDWHPPATPTFASVTIAPGAEPEGAPVALPWAQVPGSVDAYPAALSDAAGNVTLVRGVPTGDPRRGVDALLGDNDGAPDLSPLSAPANGAVGQSLAFAGSATDWSGIASLRWTFSSGDPADGGAVSHAFPAAGAQSATFTATDLAGQASAATANVAVAAPVVTPPATVVPQAAVTISKLTRTAITGTVRNATRVDVAVLLKTGKRCRVLSKTGRLGKAGSCKVRGFLRATRTGTTWRLKPKRKLARGRYVIAARAGSARAQRVLRVR